MVLKGKQKNQTKKKTYTITITNDDGYEIDKRVVQAENPREAVRIAFSRIFDQESF